MAQLNKGKAAIKGPVQPTSWYFKMQKNKSLTSHIVYKQNKNIGMQKTSQETKMNRKQRYL